MKKNLVLTLLVVFSTYSLKAQEVFSPYEGPDSTALLDEFRRESALRQRLVRINWDILNSTHQDVVFVTEAPELTLNLFPDESFSVTVDGIQQNFQRGTVYVTGRSAEGNFTYSPYNREHESRKVLTFHHPEEFVYYFIHKAADEVYLITKYPWPSLFAPYRGDLKPDESQISGKRYNLVHIHHERIFSQLENFLNGKEADIFFSPSSIGRWIMHAKITSVEHDPAQDSPGDYKITLDIVRRRGATGDNTFDLSIVDGEVAFMDITYNWTEYRRRYQVVPFDEAEGVYIMTEEMVERL